MAQKIPATVITGFLGAGKTSLLRHMAEQAGGRRLAFLINEFGDLGVDRQVLSGCGLEGCGEEDIVELANGCICCTVADDFLPAMEAILDRADPPDHILIETSGLALPKPLVRAFNWPEIRAKVTVDGVVAVVDAAAVAEGRFAADEVAVQQQREADESLDHENPLEEVFEDQLLCADMVLLNKADLVAEDGLAQVERDLSTHTRPGAHYVRTAHAHVSPEVLLGLNAAVEDDVDNRRSHHDVEGDVAGDEHDHDDFDSFIVPLSATEDADGLQARLETLVREHNILRVKGFLHRPGLARREVIQGVGPRFSRYFDRDWRPEEKPQGQLVIIGQKGLDQAAISKALTV